MSQDLSDLLHFGLNVSGSMLIWAAVLAWYVWPKVKKMDKAAALVPLLLLHTTRVNGLAFLIPGVVNDLPAGFAVPGAYGDLAAAVAAGAAAVALRRGSSLGVPLAWLFSVIGLADLGLATANILLHGVMPAHLGAVYYLVAVVVPGLLLTHVVVVLRLRQP